MKEPVSGQLLGANELTLDDHIEKIGEIRTQIKEAVLEFANAVKDAYDQLEDDTFTELAKQLGMGRSTLYKWCGIANSKFLMNNQELLPEAFGSLYGIVEVERMVIAEHGETGAKKYLGNFVKKGLFHPTMRIEDVSNIKNRVKEDFDKGRAAAQRNATGHTVPQRPTSKPIDDLVSKKKVYKTFVIEPPKEDLIKFSQSGYFQDDIRREIPIDRLLDQTADGSVLGVVIVPNKYLPTGLEMMSAWGFTYADIVPAEEKRQMLIGWRGRGNPHRLQTEYDLFEELERIGKTPRISIWYETEGRKGWSSVPKDKIKK